MTKGDKIKEVENSIKMYEKDIEDCGNETSKELLEKELEEKQDMLKELQSLTDEEFEYYMRYRLPLNKEMIKNGVKKNRKIRSEVASNIIIAKQELEKREKALKEKVKRCNEISNKADNYLKRKSISSVLDENNSCKPIFVNNMPKISEMKEGVEYIEKGTGSTVKIQNLIKRLY